MSTKRIPIVLPPIVRGTGKTYKHRHYGSDLIVGQKGTGKTTLCLEAIREHIADCKRNNKACKVFIYANFPDEYKSVRPRATWRNLKDIKSGIYVLREAQLPEIHYGQKNSLIIIDYHKVEPLAFNFVNMRSAEYNVVVTCESIKIAHNCLMTYAKSVLLFDTLDVQKHEYSELFSIAVYARILMKRFHPVVMDIYNQKLRTTNSDQFHTAIVLKAKNDAIGKTVIEKIMNTAKLILEYSKFWGGK